MYLTRFNLTEKENFWVLANYFTKVDGVLHEKEDEYLSLYAQEMGINRNVLEKTELDVDNAIEFFKNAEHNVQVKVYIELVALALCDTDFHVKEKEWLKKLQNKLNISEEKKMKIVVALVDIFGKYTELEKIINE